MIHVSWPVHFVDLQIVDYSTVQGQRCSNSTVCAPFTTTVHTGLQRVAKCLAPNAPMPPKNEADASAKSRKVSHNTRPFHVPMGSTKNVHCVFS